PRVNGDMRLHTTTSSARQPASYGLSGHVNASGDKPGSSNGSLSRSTLQIRADQDAKNAAGQGQIVLDLSAKPAPKRQEAVIDLVSPRTPASVADSLDLSLNP